MIKRIKKQDHSAIHKIQIALIFKLPQTLSDTEAEASNVRIATNAVRIDAVFLVAASQKDVGKVLNNIFVFSADMVTKIIENI